MRTFPKALATLRKFVEQRGQQLRDLTYEDLKRHANEPIEHVTIDSRPSTISIYVQPRPDGTLRVVVQGFMKARLVPGKHVALDGFYKHPDGTVMPMLANEFYEFD